MQRTQRCTSELATYLINGLDQICERLLTGGGIRRAEAMTQPDFKNVGVSDLVERFAVLGVEDDQAEKVDDIAKDAAKHGAIAFMVSVDPPDATVRVNITARESQIEKIDALAEAAGLTRSGYMVRAAISGEKQVVRTIARRAGKLR